MSRTKAQKISGIYALCCPETNQIRYIGQSENINQRYAAHCSASNISKQKNYYGNWLRSLKEKPVLRIIEITNNLDEREMHWISFYSKNGMLVNVGKGGEGYPKSAFYSLARKLRCRFGSKSRIAEIVELMIQDYRNCNSSERQVLDQRALSLLGQL